MDPDEKYAQLRSSGFIEERQIYRRRWYVSQDLGVAANREWIGAGTASRVIYYIKELDKLQASEPVGQVEGVSFYFSPLS